MPALLAKEYTPAETAVVTTAAPALSVTLGAAAHGESKTHAPPTSDSSDTGATVPLASTDPETTKAP